MNYEDLKARIEERMENSFTKDEHDTFIRQSEFKIYNSVQSLAQKQNKTTALTPSNRFLTMPTDWLYTLSFAVVDDTGRYNYLLRKDVNFIREAYPNPTTEGIPKHYAEFDENTFILGPTPNADLTVQLHYGYVPESMVTAGTTWLGDNAENTLYAAVSVQAAIFLKLEQDMMALYKDEYTQALLELKQLVDGRQEQDSYRAGFPRTQVI